MSLSHFLFTDRCQPVVELGIGDSRVPTGQARWDVQRWDAGDALWTGDEPVWLDVTCDVYSAECSYGRARSIDRFVAGTATVLVDNATGWADPDAPDDPGVLTVRPGRPIRFGVIHQTFGTCWLFRGFIDAVNPTYVPEQTDTVELACIDALGEVNRAKLVAQNPPVGSNEGAATRVHRILTAANWPVGKRDVDPSGVPVQASDIGGQVADLLGVIAESVGGAVFGNLNGEVAFRNRDWQVYEAGSPPDGIIGNVDCGTPDTWVPAVPAESGWLDPSISTGGSETHIGVDDQRTWTVDQADAIVRAHPTIPGYWVPGRDGDVVPISWNRPFERADIATRVILGRAGDDPWNYIQRDDIEGQTLYGIEPYERTGLLTADTGYLGLLADRILETRSHSTAPRVRAVSFDASTHRNVVDLMATVDVYKPSRYQCRFQLPDRFVFDDEYLATGVNHRLTPTQWTLDLNLDLAAPYVATGISRWDWSVWDNALWSSVASRAIGLSHDLAALTGATP